MKSSPDGTVVIGNPARSTVYITQDNPAADYTPAIKYGELVFVTAHNDRLSPHSASSANTTTIEKIRSILADFKEEDYFLCTGAPAHMAMSAAYLGSRLKKLLVWDNRSNDYFVVKM